MTLPFGTALNVESNGATNRRFTSYDRSSATGLDYANNRHYDPQQGRFTQVDPIGMRSTSLSSPQTLNLYAYCTNDPINHTDPSGLGFFSFLKKIFNRVVHAFIHAVITAVFTLLTTGSLHAAIGAGVADFFKELGFPTKGFGVKIGGTPQWNPNVVSILSGGPSALSRYIIVNLTAVAQTGVRVPLSGVLLALFISERNRLLKLLKDKNSDCAKFLKKQIGLAGSRIAKTVRGQRPFDAMASTLNMGPAGLNPRIGLFSDTSVPDFFQQSGASAGQANYARASMGATFRDVYYAPKGIYASSILHESLHTFYGPLNDPELASRLGATTAEFEAEGSLVINRILAEHGCK